MKYRSSVITTKSGTNLKQLAVGVCTIHGSLRVLIHIGIVQFNENGNKEKLRYVRKHSVTISLKPEIGYMYLKFRTDSSPLKGTVPCSQQISAEWV